MQIIFSKMHGAGNDFVLIDDRDTTFRVADVDWLQRIGARRTGIGCDGFILIQPPLGSADFRMRFLNPDGSEVDMCGNAARCVARFASAHGIAQSPMSFETPAGLIHAELQGDQVRVGMTEPHDWRFQRTLALPDCTIPYNFVNSGVPHVVVNVDELGSSLDDIDICRLGSAIRYHNDFAPEGTNANFIQKTGAHSLTIRTYERGVEDETLACGTGVVAAALLASRAEIVTAPVAVTCRSLDVLTIDFALSGDKIEDLSMTGPAVHVYNGTLEHPA